MSRSVFCRNDSGQNYIIKIDLDAFDALERLNLIVAAPSGPTQWEPSPAVFKRAARKMLPVSTEFRHIVREHGQVLAVIRHNHNSRPKVTSESDDGVKEQLLLCAIHDAQRALNTAIDAYMQFKSMSVVIPFGPYMVDNPEVQKHLDDVYGKVGD